MQAPCTNGLLRRIPQTASAVLATTLAAWALPVQAASLEVQITLPEIEAATYYRPYLAAWIESPQDQQILSTVAVWYDTRLRDNIGKGWLRDLRTWWRKAGQELTLPADGISGATRPPGTHTLHLAADHAALANLPQGSYQMAVEVARENGGRELLRVPFEWAGAQSQPATHGTEGRSELARLSVTVKP